MNPNELPALIVAITGLVTAIGTLITVLKSHSTINTIQTQTNGTLDAIQNKLDVANARVAGRSRVTDAPLPPADPASPPAAAPPGPPSA